MKRNLIRETAEIFHYQEGKKIAGPPSGVSGDLTGVRGNLTGVRGDLAGVRGDLTWVRGNLTGVRGNLDMCDLTDAERRCGVSVDDLIAINAPARS